MNHLKTSLILALAAVASSGADASALSNLSITSFSLTASAGTLSILPDQNYRTFDAQATTGGGLVAFDESSWSGSTTGAVSGAAITQSSTGAYSSQSTITTALMSLGATALSSAPIANAQPNASFSIGNQSGAFTLSQAGIVTLTIGYSASLSTSFSSSIESAYALAGIDIGNYGTGLDMAKSVSWTATGLYSGTLSVQIAMTGPTDFGYYTLDGRTDASSIAAVPEPETWALFPVGLIGVATWLARRRKQDEALAA